MEKLNYEVLEKSGYTGYIKKEAPVKVLQFGEGNFLRAFVDYFFDDSNETADWNGKVALVQPIGSGLTDIINSQEGLYTLYLRGSDKGERVNLKRVISVVDKCYNPYVEWDKVIEIAKSDDLEFVTSNTTEAGIVYDPDSKPDQIPPVSFPAKLAVLLNERFKAGKKGVAVLSCELIDNNGKELQKIINMHIDDWGWGDDFKTWINEENLFCSTLVDRIVPGRIRDPEELSRLNEENGYEDALLDVGEIFGVWYIEGPKELEDQLPFKKAGLNVHVVPDVVPYKKRKVRILNGAHTGFVLGAYLAGQDIVRDCMKNEAIHGFMNKMLYDEVIPVLPLPKDECDAFAEAVTDRFNNPFVDHQLLSISLNSTSKWKARNMPSFLDYIDKFGKLPEALTMSLAAYIAFYSSDIKRLEDDGLVLKRPAGNEYKAQDDRYVLEFFYDHKDRDDETLVKDVLSYTKMWDMDMTTIDGLTEKVTADLKLIREEGVEAAYRSVL
ncbi:MAG: tagaturonate reductase [Clostridiales bacterium]|nr:tagaturonate reductase [Clostridiales bacterium]